MTYPDARTYCLCVPGYAATRVYRQSRGEAVGPGDQEQRWWLLAGHEHRHVGAEDHGQWSVRRQCSERGLPAGRW